MRERRASAVALVLAAACSVQGGAAVAKSLFPQLGPPGVVFLRLLFGSAALWAIARPQLRGRPRSDLRLVGALGVVLVSMNITFYEALDRAPLGVVVTIEFLGPLAVAVLGSRKAVDFVWVILAASGVALLANGGGAAVKPLGIVLAAVAGFFWALYILLSVRVGRAFSGATGLAPAMALGAVLMAPWGIISAGHHCATRSSSVQRSASACSRPRCRGRSSSRRCGVCRRTSSVSCCRSSRRSQRRPERS